ncbi:MAG TPA: LCP family protein [Gaiellaceae bacterium]|jgi:LCP family protein required for cell wall assembly|nr:LCP family protein [Gaiellaceae bacterium]
MAPPGGEKPYRLYRGGRVKGRVPTVERPARERRPDADGRRRYRGPGPKPTARRPRKIRWGREIGIAIVLIVLFFLVWAVIGYLAFRSGVSDANKRLPRPARRALAPDRGSMVSTPSNILLLGTDHSLAVSHSGDRHADSITLLRTDPDHGRLYYLSIPRDLVVGIPGYGQAKINAATQIGGPRLAIRTVGAYTSLPVNHVVIVNIPEFREVIDKIGGIDITVPKPILSKFECPYGTAARCARWPGWRFRAGRQHMNGRRAVIYARVRKNALGSDTDITRGERQQQVLQALMSKLASFSTFVRMPWIGGDLMKPLATDLSTNEFLELGLNKVRAGSTFHCRLGGTATGASDITPSEDNAKVILMILGRSAPQPPAPTGDTFPPGCFVGAHVPG